MPLPKALARPLLCLAAVAATLPAPTAHAQSFILGAGQMTCAQALSVVQNGTPLDRGQMIGWIMGYWSAASTVDTHGLGAEMQRVGGQAIANLTISECRGQPPEAPLYLVSQALVANTVAALKAQADSDSTQDTDQ